MAPLLDADRDALMFLKVGGSSVLHIATSGAPGVLIHDRLAMVKMLINTGCASIEQDSQGRTPLHLAAMRDDADTFELLLTVPGGVEALNSRSNDGYTAYEYAVDAGSSAIEEIILQHGVPRRTPRRDRNPNMQIEDRLTGTSTSPHQSPMKRLASYGIDSHSTLKKRRSGLENVSP